MTKDNECPNISLLIADIRKWLNLLLLVQWSVTLRRKNLIKWRSAKGNTQSLLPIFEWPDTKCLNLDYRWIVSVRDELANCKRWSHEGKECFDSLTARVVMVRLLMVAKVWIAVECIPSCLASSLTGWKTRRRSVVRGDERCHKKSANLKKGKIRWNDQNVLQNETLVGLT